MRLVGWWTATLMTCAVALASAGAAGPAAAGPAWLPPATVVGESPAITVSDIVSGPDGTVVVAWADDVLPAGSMVAVRPPGGSFGEPQRLSDPARNGSAPLLAIDEHGTVVAVWAETVGGFRVVRASVRPAGGAWRPPQTISGGGQDTIWLDVAIADDVAVATWCRYVGSDVRVQAGVKPKGTPFFASASDLSPPGGKASQPSVAMDPAGRAIIGWSWVQGATPSTIRAAVRAPDGDFLVLPDVFTAPSGLDHTDGPKVALDPAGRATLMWEYYNAGTTKHVIKAAARGTSGSFGDVDDVSDPAGDAGPYGLFDFAVDDQNTAVAVWNPVNGPIQSAVRLPGGSFGAASAISGPGAGLADAIVRFDPSGRAFASWVGRSGSLPAVQVATRPRGGAFGAVTDLALGDESAPNPVTFRGPAWLSADPQGNVAAAWVRSRDADPGPGVDMRYSGQIAAYDAAPPTITSAAFPASGLAGAALPFSASAIDVWSPVTYSWAFGDGGTAPGAAVAHAYAGPGAFGATVTATDALGNAATAAGTVGVARPAAAAARGTAARLRPRQRSAARCR